MSVFDGLPGIFTTALGESVVYQPAAGGSPVTILGRFELRPQVSLESPGVQSEAPWLSCDVGDLPAGGKPGDTVTLQGTTYTVRAIRRDEVGMVDLQLEES